MIRLAIRVDASRAEVVLAELLELVPSGVEEVELDGQLIEYAAYGAPGELPALPALRALAGDALVEISTSEIADDWQERWRRFHRPVLIPPPAGAVEAEVPALRIRPPWEARAPRRAGRVEEVVIDPAQAFGTGAHASTRLCLELLLEVAARSLARHSVIDLGTGSGVLAIAAAKLGFAPVLALDNDPDSLYAASQNARENDVQIEVRRLDLRTETLPRPSGPPPLLCANLLRPLLLELAKRLSWRPAAMIAGGLLEREADELSLAFARQLDLHERERRAREGWCSLLLSARAQGASGISVAARTIER